MDNVFSESLILIVFFIQRSKNNQIEHKNQFLIEELYCDKIKRKIGPILLIFLCSVIDSISLVSLLQRDKTLKMPFYQQILLVLLIGFVALLTIFFLHYKYYKHHYFGWFIVLIGLIVFSIIHIIQGELKIDNYIGILLSTISDIISCFMGIIEKYLIEFLYYSPYFVIGIEGIFGFAIMSVVVPILQFVKCTKIDDNSTFHFINITCENNQTSIENVTETFKLILSNSHYIIGVILFTIGTFLFNLFRMITLQVYTPVHTAFINSIIFLLDWIILEQNEEFTVIYYIGIGISYFIILIGHFIFLEFIVVNKWGMNKNTTFNIAKRAAIENLDIINFSEHNDILNQDDKNGFLF